MPDRSFGNGQVLIKLGDDEALDRELRTYLQTEQYASRKLDGTQPPTTANILKERLADNRQRRECLTVLLGTLVNEAEFYAAGKKLTVKAGSPLAAVEEALTYLIENTLQQARLPEEVLRRPQSGNPGRPEGQ